MFEETAFCVAEWSEVNWLFYYSSKENKGSQADLKDVEDK